MKARTRWILIIIGALIVLGGGFAWLHRGESAPAIQFESDRVTRGDIESKVTASGTLQALVTVSVGSQVSGRINEIFVDYNSPVKKGQVLARLDTDMLTAQLEQARANEMSAEAEVAKTREQLVDAERQFARQTDLAAKGLATVADRDTADTTARVARANVQAAQASVAQAKAQLRLAQTNLAYATITSPINGVVISRAIDVGQTVAASFQAPTLFTIAEDLSHMEVDASVAEADVGHVQAGMSATFFVDAYPGETFVGSIRQVRHAPTTVQNVVTYTAVIDVENKELKLKPGMTANVTIVTEHRDNVLLVPNAALRFKAINEMLAGEKSEAKTTHPAQGKSDEAAASTDSAAVTKPAKPEAGTKTVWVLHGTHASRVSLHVGITNGSLTEVLSGDLREGDEVVTDATSTTPKKTNLFGPPAPKGGGNKGGPRPPV